MGSPIGPIGPERETRLGTTRRSVIESRVVLHRRESLSLAPHRAGLIGSLRSDYRFRHLLKPVPPLGFVTAHVPSAVGYRLVRTSPSLVSSEGVLNSSTSLTCLAVFYCLRRSSTTPTGECLDISVKTIHTHINRLRRDAASVKKGCHCLFVLFPAANLRFARSCECFVCLSARCVSYKRPSAPLHRNQNSETQ